VIALIVRLIIRVPIGIIEVGLPHGPLEPLPHAREGVLIVLNNVILVKSLQQVYRGSGFRNHVKLTGGTLVNIVAALDFN
jgi:hypothetical protein